MRIQLKTAVAGLLLSGAALLLLGLTGTFLNAQAPVTDPAAIVRGKATFSANCAFCHGSEARGTAQAPNLLRSQILDQDKNGDVLGPFLKHGRPALGMPSFASLPSAQATDIAAFLHATSAEHRATRVPETAILVGNAQAGRAFFNGAGTCSTCHSPTGDLKGIGGKLRPLALTTAFLTPPSKPLGVKVTLPSGVTLSGTLKDLNEFSLAMVDSSGAYHSWPRSSVHVEVTDPLAAHKRLLSKYTDTEIHDLTAYLVTLK